MQNVTLAILAQNEVEYIDSCLCAHAPFFDKIIILDGNSTDDTVKIAEKYAPEIYLEGELVFAGFDDRRNYLASKCDTEWILFVDVDELFDPNFLSNMDEYVREDSKVRKEYVVAFKFPRQNLDNGHPIDYHVRLYKPAVCEWAGIVHETLVLKATGKRVDQVKVGRIEICQILGGHDIKHLKRSIGERLKQRDRWRELAEDGCDTDE